MKKGKYILTLLALSLLTACSSDELSSPAYTVGEADNAITLGAGIAEGGSGVMSRAVDGNHAGHTTLAKGTKMRLRVVGTWLGKADNYRLPHGSITSGTATQTTTASVGEETTNGSKHNKVEFTPAEQLYWDDYGTADPNNIDSPNGTAATGTGGRGIGLTIHAAAVNNATVNAPEVSSWTALTWTLPVNQSTATNNVADWTAYDLLTSNNITATADGTYKFDDAKISTGSNLLEFTHAMSKVTVVLTAGEGFDGYATDPAAAKFKEAPTVKLLGFYDKGTVNIEAKTSTPTTSSTSDINMHRDGSAEWVSSHTATFDAIVFPGNGWTDATKGDNIIELTADGNHFFVTAEKLYDKLTSVSQTALEQGYNYVIKITVNKTKIENVEATIVDWKTYETDGQIIPKINVTASYGQTMSSTNVFEHNFEFFRSLNKDQKYSKDATVHHSEAAGVHSYTLSTPLYWPDHSTHYFFRGVHPLIGDGTGQIPEAKVTASDAEKQKEYISVENGRYAADTYPSDLAIGYPRTSSVSCSAHSKDVDTYGICATEGTITMNFEYAMSQVEVKLSTTENTDDSHVIIDANTVIKIVGGYDKANILLKDGSASFTGIEKADWTMPINGTDYANRHDAIVPQTLGDMKFMVTVRNANDTYDTYECKIADIQVKEKLSGGTYGALTSITKWEPGKKYVYELKLKKTAITAVATITPWTEVKAEENIWF